MSNVYYKSFDIGRKTKANLALQERLKSMGFDPGDLDGIYGTSTKKAIKQLQLTRGLPETGEIDRETEEAIFPGNYRKRTQMSGFNLKSFLSTFVASTMFKYLVAMLATYLATKFGIEQARIEGILFQVVGFVMGFWGMTESAIPKAVDSEGQRVPLAKMSPANAAKVEAIVAEEKKG